MNILQGYIVRNGVVSYSNHTVHEKNIYIVPTVGRIYIGDFRAMYGTTWGDQAFLVIFNIAVDAVI